MKSTSHRSVFTGILDMNGNRIYNGSKVHVHDHPEIYKKNDGIVIWRKGNYEVKGTYHQYNVYAWRKNIEVLIPKATKPYFHKENMEDEWESFSRTLSIMEKSRAEIKRAFIYAWTSKVQHSKLIGL